MVKRFRKTHAGHVADVWLELGLLRYRAELYEDGDIVALRKGRRPSEDESQVFLTGKKFSALLHINPRNTVRCFISI